MARHPKTYTIVIKLGSSSLVDEETRDPRIANMSLIVETVVKLRRDGHRVIIVSSGGIAFGLKRIGLPKRPKKLSLVQAVAAIGQGRLIALWDDMFRQLGQPIAQILLTRNDIADRNQYLNAANTLQELIHMGVVPIVNENDTLSVSEIRFGDNDTLSAITAGMVNANYLFLMTDVDCLYTDNPRSNPEAKPILIVDDLSQLDVDVSSMGSNVGTGGMTTKLIAAELATSAGVTTIITKSDVPGNIAAIVKHIQSHDYTKGSLTASGTNSPMVEAERDGHDVDRLDLASMAATLEQIQAEELKDIKEADVPLHTRFLPNVKPVKDRAFWLLHALKPHGTIFIDQGAYKALVSRNKAGLLPAGVIGLEGTFQSSECVTISAGSKGPDGLIDKTQPITDVGRALVNYSSGEILRIMGKQSHEIDKTLGYADSDYIAPRYNLAFFPAIQDERERVLADSEKEDWERSRSRSRSSSRRRNDSEK